MPRGRPKPDVELDDITTVEAALMAKIRRNPPVEELVPLVQAWSKVQLVKARIDKGDFMSGFDEDDPPSLPLVRQPP
jgi:hypothetical protein